MNAIVPDPPHRFSIRKKLFLIRIGIGLCVGLVIGAASVWIAAIVLSKTVERDMNNSAKLISGQVRQAVRGAMRALPEMAQSQDMEKYHHTGRSEVLAALFWRYTFALDRIALLNYDGGIELAVDRGQLFEEPVQGQASTDGYAAAVSAPNTLVLDGLIPDPGRQFPCIRYYYNRVDYFDNQMGVLRGDLTLDRLEQELGHIFALAGQMSVLVINRDGRTVYGPRKQDLGKTTPFTRQLGHSNTGYLGKHNVYGRNCLVASCAIEGFPWQTVVLKPASVINTPLYTLFGLVFIVTVLVMVTGALISQLLGIRILEPIDRLTHVISDILESGDLTRRVTWASGDEMGTLAGLFNAMLGKIDAEQIALGERRTRELELEVSRRKKDQERLRAAIVEAEAATRAKSEFLANMSHEIRTPMNGIMGMAELALESDLNENQAYLVRTISSEAESLMSIINGILDFSKIEAGKLELSYEPFNLRTLMEDLADTFAVTARKKGIEFICLVPPKLPVRFNGDRMRLRQILVNLAGNALKFTHEGEIVVWIDRISDQGEYVEMRFCIRDTGIGIAEHLHESIFDSFCQADGSASRKYGGTGLGTTIAKELVEKMGGRIGLESVPGDGSLFWFTLALEKVMEPDSAGEWQNLGRGGRVLVVDPSESRRSVLISYLSALGFSPVSAESCERAVIWLEDPSSEDLMLVFLDDSQKGDMSLLGSKVPVILMIPVEFASGKANLELPELAGVLAKPVHLGALDMLTRSVLGIPADIPAGSASTDASQAFFDNRKIRILLAEDYPTNQEIVTRHLKDQGFSVVLAEDGKTAVSLFEQQNFDLVFMDIQMPVMDGYEATRRIRMAETGTLRVPIIAMTAHAIKGYREKCLETGMDDYITKPVKRRELIRMVETWVLKKNSPEEAGMDSPGAYDETSPVDMNLVMREFESDTTFYKAVLTRFLTSLDERITQIEAAVAMGDFKTLKEQAHTIKGGAANVAAMGLSDAAKSLEAVARGEKSDPEQAYLARVRTEYRRLKAFSAEL